MKRIRRGRRGRRISALLMLSAIVLGLCYLAWRRGIVLGLGPTLQVENLLSGVDANGNGIDDLLDILEGARAEVRSKPTYKSAYYEGGYPPDDEGVCTDLVWRALFYAGYDLKTSVDQDIAEATEEYPRVEGKPDTNIDFRRVPNLHAFFMRNAQTLTTDIVPWDQENAAQWQPGDIVIFGPGHNHIGIVSDKRRRDGIPLVIHHGWGRPVEDNALGYYKDQVVAHFRLDLGAIWIYVLDR